MINSQANVPNELEKGKRLGYLEGIRGVAAFMVVIHHYLLAFYPTQASGEIKNAHFAPLELWYYHSPFIFLTNGQFFVYIFFALSGYVLSKKYFLEKEIAYLNSAFIRRLPRLYIPMAFSLVIAFLLMKLTLDFNIEASTITKSIWFAALKGDHSVFKFIESLLIKTMFFKDNSYNTVLWTISAEFYGSLLLFSALALTGKIRNSFWVFITILILLLISENFEYAAFILGYMLNYNYVIKFKQPVYRKFFVVFIIILGLFLGGFPHIYYKDTPTIVGTFYQFLNYNFIIKRGAFINETGAFLIILAVLQSDKLQVFFSNRIFDFLGAVSFSMYLIHVLVLQSFSSFLFLKLQASFGYNISFLFVFFPSVALILLLSYVMTIYVDKKSLNIAHFVYKNYFS